VINTYAIQTITAEKWSGFSISLKSAMIRQLMYSLRKAGIDVTRQDIIDSLNYMLSRGWLVHSGWWGSQKLYNYTNK